jgi:hypothetical protein
VIKAAVDNRVRQSIGRRHVHWSVKREEILLSRVHRQRSWLLSDYHGRFQSENQTARRPENTKTKRLHLARVLHWVWNHRSETTSLIGLFMRFLCWLAQLEAFLRFAAYSRTEK